MLAGCCNDLIIPMDKKTISSIISLTVAVVILLTSFFQWWDITLGGKMPMRKWTKILFSALIVALVIALVLILL